MSDPTATELSAARNDTIRLLDEARDRMVLHRGTTTAEEIAALRVALGVFVNPKEPS